jgi:hypothetical protein
VEWNREFATDIQSFRAAEQELVQEKFLSSREEELNRLARFQKDMEDELANRPLKFIPIEKLFRIAMDLRHEIQALQTDLVEDADMPRPDGGRHNGNGHGRTRPVNRRRAVQTSYGHAELGEEPSNSVEAVASDRPPAPLIAANPHRNGVHAEKPAQAPMPSAPSEPEDHNAALATNVETPHPSPERNGESSNQTPEGATSSGCAASLRPLDTKSTRAGIGPDSTSPIQKPTTLGHFFTRVAGQISSLFSQPVTFGERSSCPTPRRSRRTTKPNTIPL